MSIIPKDCVGEQYADDVALVFKPSEMIVSQKTKYQQVDIVRTPTWGQILFLDNLLMKTENDGHIINEMIVHPVMLTGTVKKKVLVVGGGEGFTTTELLKYGHIEKIDVIDIDTEFVDICRKYYPKQTKCFDDPRVRLISQDGLEYLRSTSEIYDAIFITPTDPLGLSNPLFVDEYYELCRARLSDDGICQTDAYMPFYKYGDIDYAVIRKNMAKYFPITKVYIATVPTFPGGLFSFVMGSKKYDPIADQKKPEFDIKTRYYNGGIHKACFALPQFMLDRIDEE
ncbi:MAG: spermidine synthase [Alphaproteobacteria bacterium]|nr:spermidine synthase [Alphaproteobacteria bacterium]